MRAEHAVADLITTGGLVLDIGAYAGNKAEWFAARGARVVCVEPQPGMAKALRQRFADNERVTIIEKGVGAKPGTAILNICETDPVLSTFKEHWQQGRFLGKRWDRQHEVALTTLADLVDQHGVPDYCKIDVEGAEVDVLRGLDRRIGIISFEFTAEYLAHAAEAIQLLGDLGYDRYNFSIAEQPAFHLEDWTDGEDLLAQLSAASTANIKLWGDIYAR